MVVNRGSELLSQVTFFCLPLAFVLAPRTDVSPGNYPPVCFEYLILVLGWWAGIEPDLPTLLLQCFCSYLNGIIQACPLLAFIEHLMYMLGIQ